MKLPRLSRPAVLACAALLVAAGSVPASAQRVVRLAPSGNPIFPPGPPIPPVGDGPFDYDTLGGQKIRVDVMAKGLDLPYAIAFLPDGTILVTERPGRIRAIRNGVLDPTPVPGGPAAYWPATGRGPTLHGYMNIALHPKFAQNRWLYLSYAKSMGEKDQRVAVARATWTDKGLTDIKDIWVSGADTGSSTPIAFGGDGKLYIATSRGEAQDPMSTGGKVMRVNDDGSTPSDNPFVGKAGYLPQLYTLGHRNSLGLAAHPVTGKIYNTENGPNGGDEINLIEAGKNYGWPLVSYGRTYPGPWQSKQPTSEGYEAPIVFWVPAIAVSGITFYQSPKIPGWTGDILVGGMRVGEVAGTGRIDRVMMNEKMEEVRRESVLGELRQRIRDVKTGPDGLVYAVTDTGALLRVSPR
jgi:glucose/arabinose dehydrogenase